MPPFKVIVEGRALAFDTLRAAARHFGINERLAQSRKQEGWTPEQICEQAPSPSGRIRRSQAEINEVLSRYSLQYDHLKNTRPLAYYGIGSKKRVWWRCDNCKQSYPCGIDTKIRQSAKCPICRDLPLQGDEFPALREIFCEADNGLPLDAVVRGTHRKYWFKCSVCGDRRKRVFKNVVAALKRGKPGCEYCYRRGGGIVVENDRRNKQRIAEEGSLADNHPAIAAEWDYTRNSRAPQDYLSKSGYDAHWVCSVGHRWKASISSRVRQDAGCRKCGHHISQYEKRVVAELRELGFEVAWNERLYGVECDVLLKKQHLVIEVDGFPWHESKEAYRRERKKESILRRHGLVVVRWRCSRLQRKRQRSALYQHEEDNSLSIKKLFEVVLAHGDFSRVEAARLRRYCEASTGYVAETEFREMHATTATKLFRESIADALPHLVASWSERNSPLMPHQVSKGSKRKVWWKCQVNPAHEWEARPTDRKRFGCPYCNGRRASPEDNFYVNHKRFCDTYVCPKRNTLNLREIKSIESLWVTCVNGHTFKLRLAYLKDRRRNDAEKTFECERCAAVMPYDGTPLLKDRRKAAVIRRFWNFSRNECDPFFLVPNQDDRFWWVCPKGHSFQQTLTQMLHLRHKVFQCPECGPGKRYKKG